MTPEIWIIIVMWLVILWLGRKLDAVTYEVGTLRIEVNDLNEKVFPVKDYLP